MRSRCHTGKGSIPIPIPISISILIGLIGNLCLEATHEGGCLFGRALVRNGAVGLEGVGQLWGRFLGEWSVLAMGLMWS
jgi:hypothetical protein